MITMKIKYNGGKIRVAGFGIQKYQMLLLGTRSLAGLKERVNLGIGSEDARMPPLKRGYAIQKTKAGKGNIRNLTLSGDMLANLSVRYADENQVKIALTQRLARVKALANEKKSSWLKWSPKDQENIVALASRIFKGSIELFAHKIQRQFRRAA